MTAMTCVKIRIDMPLPTPRSVISSPIHMMTAVPATMVITIVAIVKTDAFGMIGRGAVREQAAGRGPARRTRWTAARASPMVRYRVYWVIFAWPDWPSFFSVSSRGMTTVSSWRMMLAVMYGMMPSANTDMLQQRVTAEQVDQLVDTLRGTVTGLDAGAVVMAFSEMPGVGDRRPEPEQRDDAEREEQLLAQVWRPERPEERGQHAQPSVRLISVTQPCGFRILPGSSGIVFSRRPERPPAAGAPGDY